jgi:hypothetical protein
VIDEEMEHVDFSIIDPDNDPSSIITTAAADNKYLINTNIVVTGRGSERVLTFWTENIPGESLVTVTARDGNEVATREFKVVKASPTPDPIIHNYPNPAENSINVVAAEVDAPFTITVCDTKGNIVFSKVQNTKECTIDIQQFQPGLYFVQIIDKNGKVIQSRFMKGK